MIRRYFNKYKWQRKKRDEILAMAEDAEEFTKEVLREDYVHFLDAMPDVKEFLEKMKQKDLETGYVKQESEDVINKYLSEEGEGEGEGFDLEENEGGEEKIEIQKKKQYVVPIEEEEFDPKMFNPFDKKERQKYEELQKPLKPRKLLHIKK